MENAEKRLELIKMMRDEHKENMGRIQRREHILYPYKKLSYSDYDENTRNNKYHLYIDESNSHKNVDSPGQPVNWGFYLRLGISIGLFLIFFYMERNNISYFGITCDMVQNVISDTFDLKSFAFMK